MTHPQKSLLTALPLCLLAVVLGSRGFGTTPAGAADDGDKTSASDRAVAAHARAMANRAPDRHYRTAPLRGLWTHRKGGFYHDGRFATLDLVVAHYDTFFALGLSAGEKSDLVQHLQSL